MYKCQLDEKTIIILPTEGSPKWKDFPECTRERFAKVFLEEAYKAFERPEVQEDFENWLKERQKKK